MVWGIVMSASGDHLLSPAHGHLNLIGFVMTSVFGTYYALSPNACDSRLASFHYGLHTLTVIVMVPGIVFAIQERTEALAIIGSLLAVLSMVVFTTIVLRDGRAARSST